jgi:hypothetical protein
VTLFLPRGIVGTIEYFWAQRIEHSRAKADSANNDHAVPGPSPRPAE